MAFSRLAMKELRRELMCWYSLNISVSLAGSEIVVASDHESFDHKTVRIGLRTLHIHKTAAALELVGGDVAFPEHVEFSVGSHRVRVGEHVYLD